MKRPRAAAVETADAAASDAFTALRVARELKEDGDAEAARSCVEHAVGRARDSASERSCVRRRTKLSTRSGLARVVALNAI